MRLIDAGRLKTVIDMNIVDGSVKDLFNQYVDIQPIAYDVDKVANELDSAAYPGTICDLDGWEICEDLLKADMVEYIVKRGGVE